MAEWNVLETVKQGIVQHRLIEPNETVAAAVSGGPDSVALLHVLKQLSAPDHIGFDLVVAHVDHGFRGEESRREARGVEAMAKRLNLPFASVALDLPRYIRESGKNAQEAAREQRFAFLRETAERYGAKKIALGHHADDQAETVLMRILRGTSVAGLEGMAMLRREGTIAWIRPLLQLRKSDLIRYCEEHALPYFTDSSNAERTYFRNQVRLDVIPFLERYNPEFSSSLIRLAETAAAEGDYLEHAARETFERIVSREEKEGECCRFSRPSFLKLHVALQRRLIKLILSYLCPVEPAYDFQTIETIRRAAVRDRPATTRFDAGKGIRFVREYDRLILTKIQQAAVSYSYTVSHVPATVTVAEIGAEIEFAAISPDECPADASNNSRVMLADLDRLQLPLTVRNRRPGDRIAVYGTNGRKKIKDLFIDLKIPPSERDEIPIVTDAGGEVIWIPGIRRSAKHQNCRGAGRILHMQYRDDIQ